MPPVLLFLMDSLAAPQCSLIFPGSLHPNATAILISRDIHAFASCNPTCFAAQTNIILYPWARPSGDKVFPVPVGD